MVYSFDAESDTKEKASMAVECERCGKPITGTVLNDGTTLTASQIIGKSKIEFGGVYCAKCVEALREKKPESEAPKEQPKRKMVTDEQKKYIIDHANDEDYQRIMSKYGFELEKMTAVMAVKVIQQIDENNRAAG